MVKNTQKIRWQKPTNCLIVFDHFLGLTLKGLISLTMSYTLFLTLWKKNGFLFYFIHYYLLLLMLIVLSETEIFQQEGNKAKKLLKVVIYFFNSYIIDTWIKNSVIIIFRFSNIWERLFHDLLMWETFYKNYSYHCHT